MRPFVRDRDLRVSIGAAVTVCGLFALTLSFPVWMLALGPILLGVPHVVADIRYLVVRPGLHRDLAKAVAVGFPLVMAGVTAQPEWGAVAVLAVACTTNGSRARRWTIGLVALASIPVFGWLGLVATLVILHAHNVVGIGLWWAWRARRWLHALPVFLSVAGILALASGALDATVYTSPLARSGPGEDSLMSFEAILAPGVPAPWGGRLVLIFAFLQAVHYAVWLRWVPEDDRPQPTPRTFRASYRALRSDLGRWGLRLAVFLALAVGVWACFDLAHARETYLRAALFHAYLEFAAAAWLFVVGGVAASRATSGKRAGRT